LEDTKASSAAVDDEDNKDQEEEQENPKKLRKFSTASTVSMDIGAKKGFLGKPGESKDQIAKRRAEAAERKRKVLAEEEHKRKKARTEDRQVRAEAFEKRKLETQQERNQQKELKRKQAKEKVQKLADQAKAGPTKNAPVPAASALTKKLVGKPAPVLKKGLGKPPVSSLSSVLAPVNKPRPALVAIKAKGNTDTNVMSPPADRPTKSSKRTPSPANPFQVKKVQSPAPAQNHNADNYEMSDNNEEDEWSDSSTPRKPIPKWSSGSALQQAIAFTERTDPDSVFPPMEGTLCNLTEIFKGFRAKKRFKTRTSSGNWFPDRLQWKEEQAYKTDMGFARNKPEILD
jgi:hypothetical protein